MLGNVRSSLDRGLPVIRLCQPHDGVLTVAAGGPSLADTWRDMDGTIAAVNGSLKFLADRNIRPWACGVLDPGKQMPGIVPRVDGVNYFVASICDPSLFDHLTGLNVGLWHPSGVPGLPDVLNERRGKHWLAVAGGTTMGLRWLNLGYVLGFRKFHFHGMDSSYRGDATHAYPDHTDGIDHMIVDGYATKLAFVRQLHEFFVMLDVFGEDNIDPILIEVHGTGWLQDRWKTFKELNPDAFTGKRRAVSEDAERSKYERMWEIDDYRNFSPGESLVATAIDAFGILPGDTIIDFGCGPGRATQVLQDMGCGVLGIDIAGNSLDPGVSIPFRNACLWDLPTDVGQADFGLCCDVMEHIPPERVVDVLANIKAKVREGVLFNIAFFEDSFGSRIGERLHLTVRSQNWWLNKLKEFWPDTTIIDTPPERVPRAVFKAC